VARLDACADKALRFGFHRCAAGHRPLEPNPGPGAPKLGPFLWPRGK